MKIVSSFRDYYDGIAERDGDYKTVFVRGSTKDVENTFGSFTVPNSNKGNFGFVGFCGQLYPFFSYDVLDSDKNKLVPKYIWGDKLLDYNWGKYLYPSVERFVAWCKQDHSERANKIGPIFSYHHTNYNSGLRTSPRLESMGFAAVLPPQQSYMELYKFLCNQNRPERPIPLMPNDIKIEQHGFDLKKSFRKEKKGA